MDRFSKTKRKMCISLCLVLVLSISAGFGETGCLFVKQARAASRTRDEAVSWAVSQIGKGLDYDNAYGNQCVDLIKYYYDYFGCAGYATGNANAYITNSLPAGWTRVYSSFQPGDVAVWKVNHSCGTCNTGPYGHVGIITSADSVGFNAVNQNFNSQAYCTQNWFNISALACAIRPAFGAAPAPSVTITFQEHNINHVWDDNAEIYVKIMNPQKQTVSSVGMYLYDENGNKLKSYSETCGLATSYINYNCTIITDMGYTLQPGTTYKYAAYAIVNGQEYKDAVRSFQTSGSKPVVDIPAQTVVPKPTEQVSVQPTVRPTKQPVIQPTEPQKPIVTATEKASAVQPSATASSSAISESLLALLLRTPKPFETDSPAQTKTPAKKDYKAPTVNIKQGKKYAKSKKIVVKDRSGIWEIVVNGHDVKFTKGKKTVSFKLSKYRKYLRKNNRLYVCDKKYNSRVIRFKIK